MYTYYLYNNKIWLIKRLSTLIVCGIIYIYIYRLKPYNKYVCGSIFHKYIFTYTTFCKE